MFVGKGNENRLKPRRGGRWDRANKTHIAPTELVQNIPSGIYKQSAPDGAQTNSAVRTSSTRSLGLRSSDFRFGFFITKLAIQNSI